MTSDQALPLRVDGRPLRRPRQTPRRGGLRPVWSDYRVKGRVQCDHCAQAALDTLREGVPHEGIRAARHKRVQGGATLLLCNDHARQQRDQDRDDYADTPREGKASGGQRYLA